MAAPSLRQPSDDRKKPSGDLEGSTTSQLIYTMLQSNRLVLLLVLQYVFTTVLYVQYV